MKVRHRSKRHAPEPLRPVIFRWDLDKTYLRSEFDSLRDLVRIGFEKPQDKVTVPGVVALIRNLRAVAQQVGRPVQLYFISASPPQIAKAIKEKLALDGIEYDGIIFKNQLQHLMRGRFRNLREQVGFKLTELLKSRQLMPSDSTELLFGDDWESDPVIYSLYADILAGRIAPGDLAEVLRTIGVDLRLISEANHLARELTPGNAVERIFINLERRTPPTSFRYFGTRLLPTFNYFQTAACLFESGHLTLPAVAQVAESLIEGGSSTPEGLANSLADVMRRGHLQQSSAIAVGEYLHARGLMPRRRHTVVRPSPWQRLSRWLRAQPATEPANEVAIDYHSLVAEWRAAR